MENKTKKTTTPELEIYNIESDRTETIDLDASRPGIVEQLKKIRAEVHGAPTAN